MPEVSEAPEVPEAVGVPSGDQQPGEEPRVPSPPPQPPLGSGGEPLRPSTGERPPIGDCSLCGAAPSLVCPSCDGQAFCDACDDLFHRHPSRDQHKRDQLQQPPPGRSAPPPGCRVRSASIFFYSFLSVSPQESAPSAGPRPCTPSAPPAARSCVRTVTSSSTRTPTAGGTAGASWQPPKPPGEEGPRKEPRGAKKIILSRKVFVAVMNLVRLFKLSSRFLLYFI